MATGPDVRYAESGGLQIAYKMFGDGPLDLILLADTGTNIEVMLDHPVLARFLQRLSEVGRVLWVDPRGTGISDPMERIPPLEAWVDDIRAVLDDVGSERAALVGHGYGGQLSLLYAAMHPSRTVAVVTINGYARLRRAPDYPAGFPFSAEEGIRLSFMRDWGSGRILAWTNPDVTFGPRMMEWWARVERTSATPRRAMLRQTNAFEIDIRDVLPTIDAPTLIVQSVDDRYIHPGHSEYLLANIAGAKSLQLPGGHSPVMTDQMDKLADAIGEFLTGAPSRTVTDRALMTVAFTDIVDSTKRAADLGDHRWRGILEVHDQLSQREVEAARGRVVKFTGDGMMATFDGPARAVACVRSLRRELEEAGISIRAGVHTGEIEVRGDDIGGIAVHIAARVSGLAGAGETLTSSTVRDLVAGSGLVFQDRGMHTLKGVPDEWRIFAVADASP